MQVSRRGWWCELPLIPCAKSPPPPTPHVPQLSCSNLAASSNSCQLVGSYNIDMNVNWPQDQHGGCDVRFNGSSIDGNGF